MATVEPLVAPPELPSPPSALDASETLANLKTERLGLRKGRVLIIVQNLPVPFDRRVWLECQTLRAAGHDVSVVCPKGPGDPSFAKLEGVELYKYRPYASKGNKVSFIVEYVYSFLVTLWLSLKASRAGRRFDVVQACNPPDIFWPIGLLFKALYRSQFVFDHHDLCPELFESRFPDGSRRAHQGLLWLEGRTVASADHVIATNDSYRAVDIERHHADPDRVTVVRTGPDPARLKPREADSSLRRGRPYLVAYIGVMGPQDGVDIVLSMAHHVVTTLGRTDISFTLIGSGDCFEDLLAMRASLGLKEYVEFTGRIPDDNVAAILSTADVGICPDPKNPLNDVSTMNKTMEYMAFGLPVLAFDLKETRVSAGDAGVYATPNEVDELATLLVGLMDDPGRRQAMGAVGRARVEQELAWHHQAARYLGVYESLIARAKHQAPAAVAGA
jgi:glycosyltransferase involved in cell wall biosynthesis